MHGEVLDEWRKRKNNNKTKRKRLQDNETAEDDLRYYPGKQVFQLQRNLCSGIKAGSQHWDGNGLPSGKGTGEDRGTQQRNCVQVEREND